MCFLKKYSPGPCFLLLVMIAGCQTTPEVNPETDAAQIAGVAEPIVFQIQGGTIDVAEAAGPSLTLADAVQRTLLNSPEIQSALARVRMAQAAAKQARLLPNPILSVSLRFPTDGGGSPTIEAGLAADLIAILRRPGHIDAADHRLRVASAEALSLVLDVVAEVQARYVAVQTLGQMLVVLEDRLTIVDRLLQLSRDRLELGEGTRLDVLTFETQRIELQTDIADRRLEVRDERLALSRLIGEPSGTAQWQVPQWEATRRTALPETRWMAIALERRPEVQASRFELAARGEEVGLTRLAAFEGAEVGAEAERDAGDWSVGPAVSTPLPVFDWGQAKQDQAKAALIQARHDFTRVQRHVIEETRRAYAAWSASQSNLDRVRNDLIPLQVQRREQAEAQWKGGRTDIAGLLLAEQDLRAARTRQLELERRVSESLFRLQRAVGGPGIVSSVIEPTTVPTTLPTSPITRGSAPKAGAESPLAHGETQSTAD